MAQFDIEKVENSTMSGLKDFQRATVERIDYLFRDGQNRVLVADEVGMGKTLIARGAIVKTARIRLEEHDELFKVVYICSNQNIANQNIRKLDVTNGADISNVSDTRLSMQHLKITEQEFDTQLKEGYIQLIPLTPETSFRMTSGGGSVEERALMFAILRRLPELSHHVTSLEKFMVLDAVKAWENWAKNWYEYRVKECSRNTNGNYPANVLEEVKKYPEIIDMLVRHLEERRYGRELSLTNYTMMNKLRVMFARISVSMLQPDLVIMDEFQRFKFLLKADDSELGILTQSFLHGSDTRVLLMSATPYKLYSTLEEIEENESDEHFEEFYQVMDFLFEGKQTDFHTIWKNYSMTLHELTAGDMTVLNMKREAENAMYRGVCRTERISVMESGDYTDDSSVKSPIDIKDNDVLSYVQLGKLMRNAGILHSLPVDYVKSCPYLMSFMRNYKLKEKIEKAFKADPELVNGVGKAQRKMLWLNRNLIDSYEELPPMNARLEELKEKAFITGAEKYLWVPPARPYYPLQGVYRDSEPFSKILVFSSWEMVPRMVGAMISYEAERRTVGKIAKQARNQDRKNAHYFAEGSRRYPAARLRFNVTDDRANGMSLFCLLYPSKTLAELYVPIQYINENKTLEQIEREIRRTLSEKINEIAERFGAPDPARQDDRWYYLAPMLMDGVSFSGDWIKAVTKEVVKDTEDVTAEKGNKGFYAHIERLDSYLSNLGEINLGKQPDDLLDTLVNMTLASPAICIYRSNGHEMQRATALAKVFVNNFNMPESIAIVDLAYGRCRDDNSHWQNVLKYCKDGCFQSMFDEYLHMLSEAVGISDNTDKAEVIHKMMMDSLTIRSASYMVDTFPAFKSRAQGSRSDGMRIRSSYAVGFTKDAAD